jgi:GntR family transcriptional regulator/MocR family aminotransferase
VTDPEHIVICAGFAQGVHLVLRALAETGLRCVAVEDPGHCETRTVSGMVAAKVTPVPVDAGGMVVDELRKTAAGAVVLTPAHQTPTGVVLAPERRQALVDWACRAGATIIEDDYDAEFRYDREPVGAMQGLAPAHVALLGTVSKSLAPALRLGWIVCPPALTAGVAKQKQLADHGSPGLDQLALALLIESGRYDRHLRRMRGVYARRRARLKNALAAYAPQVELQGLEAGFHAVLQLPAEADEQGVITAARERGVGLYPMSEYRAGGQTTPPRLVLGFGNVSDDAVERGIARIADLLRGSG